MPTITLYHGTAHAFDAFRLTRDSRGEPNAALGIHLTEDPSLAASYALRAARDLKATEPIVLTVEARLERVGLTTCQVDFFGREPDGAGPRTTHHDFMAARERLMSLGFDAVATDIAHDDLKGAWVVFDPARLAIMARDSADDVLSRDAEPPLQDMPTFETIEILSPSLPKRGDLRLP